MVKEFVCIVCPRGCSLRIDENDKVEGNSCKRGEIYAINEVHNPKRTITSSIRVTNREMTVVSVKSKDPIPKGKMFEVMEAINNAKATAPIDIGDTLIANVLGLGIDIIATNEVK